MDDNVVPEPIVVEDIDEDDNGVDYIDQIIFSLLLDILVLLFLAVMLQTFLHEFSLYQDERH